MRSLTQEEKTLLDERRRGYEAFVEEMMPVLADFAERLGLSNPHMIVDDPNPFVSPISQWMRDQVVGQDDWVWIVTRLGYLIGEVLSERLNGTWFIDELPDTRYFLRYVVGQFGWGANQSVMADPFEAARMFVAQPPGRDLEQFIKEIESDCCSELDKQRASKA